jgi:signal transduction histidine kinase
MQPRNNLGLAVDGTVIEMHCGEVWARSNFGEASWFNFRLPIKEDA